MTHTTPNYVPSDYVPLDIDYEKLTINGIQFPDLELLKGLAKGITSNMYEGWRPTPKMIEITRDHAMGKISLDELADIAINGKYK